MLNLKNSKFYCYFEQIHFLNIYSYVCPFIFICLFFLTRYEILRWQMLLQPCRGRSATLAITLAFILLIQRKEALSGDPCFSTWFYWVLLGSTGFYSSHSFSAVPPLLRWPWPSANLVNVMSIFVPRGHAAAHISKVNTLGCLLAAPLRQLGQIKCLLFAIWISSELPFMFAGAVCFFAA